VVYGVSTADDKLPSIVLKPYDEGPIKGRTPEPALKGALKEYYKLRGWEDNDL